MNAHATLPAGYRITDDPAAVDIDAVHRYLSGESYWAQGRSRETVQRSIEASWCVSVLAPDGALAGFARVITDFATAYYVCDLFVLQEHRGAGLGRALVQRIVEDERLAPLSGMLLTDDAQGLYANYGFEQTDDTRRKFMRRPRRRQ